MQLQPEVHLVVVNKTVHRLRVEGRIVSDGSRQQVLVTITDDDPTQGIVLYVWPSKEQ